MMDQTKVFIAFRTKNPKVVKLAWVPASVLRNKTAHWFDKHVIGFGGQTDIAAHNQGGSQ